MELGVLRISWPLFGVLPFCYADPITCHQVRAASEVDNLLHPNLQDVIATNERLGRPCGCSVFKRPALFWRIVHAHTWLVWLQSIKVSPGNWDEIASSVRFWRAGRKRGKLFSATGFGAQNLPGTIAVEEPKTFAAFGLAKQVAAAGRPTPMLDVNIHWALCNSKQFVRRCSMHESFKKPELAQLLYNAFFICL